MTAFPIDLSSDTATRPSRAMLEAMGRAEVGDEQKGEDPTTRALCERLAGLLGMEEAVFLPSGTMCNQIAFLVHCRPGDEIIAAENAHVVGSEGAGAAALAGAQFRTIPTPDGIFDAAALDAAVRTPRHRSPRSRLVSVEQTSNRGGGRVWPVATLHGLRDAARRRGLLIHMDGARLPNAAVASGAPMAAHTTGFDSVWIDLSKGLGCPVGAVLAGARGFIDEAWRWKHRLGGAMRQSGYLAAAGLYALDNVLPRQLALDHENARLFAVRVADSGLLAQAPETIETNIVFLDLTHSGFKASEIATALEPLGIRFGVESERRMRVVTHLDVSRETVMQAAEALMRVVEHRRGENNGLA